MTLGCIKPSCFSSSIFGGQRVDLRSKRKPGQYESLCGYCGYGLELTRIYWHSVAPTLRQLEQARPVLRSPLHLIFLFRHRLH